MTNGAGWRHSGIALSEERCNRADHRSLFVVPPIVVKEVHVGQHLNFLLPLLGTSQSDLWHNARYRGQDVETTRVEPHSSLGVLTFSILRSLAFPNAATVC